MKMEWHFYLEHWQFVGELTSNFTPEEDLVSLDITAQLNTGKVETGALLNIEGDAVGTEVLDLSGQSAYFHFDFTKSYFY